MSDKAVALVVVALVAVPWAVVGFLAILRGYNIAAWRGRTNLPTKDHDEEGDV